MSDSAKPVSLEDRIGKPLDAASTSFTPSAQPSTSWADEVASPTVAEPSSDLGAAQVDGSAESASGLLDNQYEVEVKLSDLQGDVNSPLYSATSFEQLGL
jgi:ATP-dependent RNA helicase DDX19/DBP5